ncbi:MAG: RsmD family RNA methyltransferase [Prevotella sp.]|jgi:16S rRNA (guanine(966)-N(2))-methyltransferase RsmD|nr:RsmD family RNA methyltransferase [Prevotella sp.]
MRIITGIYKGRHFDVPHTFKARPTTDFAKENLFNVLQGYTDLEDSTALDLFSGTGSITLELLSRGCREVVSVEKDRDHSNFIRQCVEKLNIAAEGQTHRLIRGDVFKYMKSCKQQFDFIFADPPYSMDGIDTIPQMALPLLQPEGLLVVEHGKQNDFSQLPQFLDHRQYGSVNFSIFRNEKATE